MMFNVKVLSKLFKAGTISVLDLNFAILKRIEKTNFFINFLCHGYYESYIRHTKRILLHARYIRNQSLTGLTIGIKDQICIKNRYTEASSLILNNYKSNYNSWLVFNIIKAGALIIGKTNMDEFGIGFASFNSLSGEVFNPWSYTSKRLQLCGGSSSGSAALSCVVNILTLGTDTGGSVRQPAAFTGIIGFKPSYGRCSRWGTISYCSSFDQVAFFSKHYVDIAELSKIVFGKDQKDWNTLSFPVQNYRLYDGFSNVGLILKRHLPYFNSDWCYCLSVLDKIGFSFREIELKLIEFILPMYCIISSAECYLNFCRFDSIRYGLKFKCANFNSNQFSVYRKIRNFGFALSTKIKLMTGLYVLSLTGKQNKYYYKAQLLRFVLRKRIKRILNVGSVIVLPSVPNLCLSYLNCLKFKFESDIYTILANLLSFPSVVIPTTITTNPVCIQVLANEFYEAELFSLCSKLQKLTGVIDINKCL